MRKINNYMAILRNLRNCIEAGVSPAHIEKLSAAITDANAVKYSRQLPFRFFSAYQNLPKGHVLQKAVSNALDMSCDNLPYFPGRTMSLTDNSGSAHEALTSEFGSVKVATIGNLMGLMTGRRADEGYVGVFGNRLDIREVQKKKFLLDQLVDIEAAGMAIGHNTENGIWLFFDKAIKEKEHWDNIFIYSDQQAGYGLLYGIQAADYKDYIFPESNGRMIDVGALVARYRKEVNPKVMVYLVQTAGYNDTLVPEYYNRTFVMGGWSQNILHFAHEMNKLFDT